jgi:hypothetical protein
MALMTQETAKDRLREATGRSWQWCIDTVKAMPKTPDGCRLKVTTKQVEAAIKEANAPVEVKEINIRPISKTKRQRIAERCL